MIKNFLSTTWKLLNTILKLSNLKGDCIDISIKRKSSEDKSSGQASNIRQSRINGNTNLLVPNLLNANMTPEGHMVGSASTFSVASAYSEYNVGGKEAENPPKAANQNGQPPISRANFFSRKWAKNVPWLEVILKCLVSEKCL